jgi:ABC-type branched-subunit amino acid transport system ATPase component
MKSVREHGHAVLLVEQNFALAMAVADYIHVVSAGRFVFEGTPAELNDAPEVLEQHLGVAQAH